MGSTLNQGTDAPEVNPLATAELLKPATVGNFGQICPSEQCYDHKPHEKVLIEGFCLNCGYDACAHAQEEIRRMQVKTNGAD